MSDPEFQVKAGKNGCFFYTLTGYDRKIVFSGQKYTSKQGCRFGIDSVRKNAQFSDRYSVKAGKYGQIYFVLRAPNSEILGKSKLFNSIQDLQNGIELVKNIVPIAEINYYLSEASN